MRFSEDDLIRKIQEHPKGKTLSDDLLKVIVNFCSLTFLTYAQNDAIFSINMLRRKERLTLCPIIRLQDQSLILGNQICFGSMSFWLETIKSGDFPYRLPPNSPFDSALQRLHRKLDIELEEESERKAKTVTGEKYVEGTIDNFRRLSPLFPSKPPCGEIDLLVANPHNMTLFVLDAKNINRRMRGYDIRLQFRTFFEGDNSYLAKLKKKELFIKENILEVLKHFGISNIEGWKTRKGFIMDNNFPIASSNYQAEVDFVIIDNLVGYLNG